jgi:hypothetical protein
MRSDHRLPVLVRSLQQTGVGILSPAGDYPRGAGWSRQLPRLDNLRLVKAVHSPLTELVLRSFGRVRCWPRR